MGTGVRFRTTTATAQASSTPITPPAADSINDSTRNWFRMSLCLAPTDLRIPISCVRSVTTASMMFMITTPPTTMNTETIAMAVAAITPRQLVPDLHERIRAEDREVVLLLRPQSRGRRAAASAPRPAPA